jgi:hypothetical protein
MKGGKTPLGYTIVEVLIVLAVSAMMFLIAANFINGKQERTAFTQGSNELVAQLQSVVDDINNGNYTDQQINCGIVGSGISFSVPPNSGQGTNQDCVFFGKLVHFYRTAGVPLPENYETFLLAAKRTADGSSLLSDAQSPQVTSTNTTPQGLDIANIRINNAVNSTNIGFALDVGTASGGPYQGGAQTISLIYLPGLSNAQAAAGNIHGSNMQVAKSATVCVTDGTRKAKILIGGTANNGNQFSIGIEQQGLGKVCT